jgi:hypothetical protein
MVLLLATRLANAMRIAGGVVLLTALLADQPAFGQEVRYLEELVEGARQKGLAEQRQWLALGHYRHGLFGSGWISVIDSRDFFLAPAGRKDPKAELEATIAGFFAPPSNNLKTQHQQCALRCALSMVESGARFRPGALA